MKRLNERNRFTLSSIGLVRPVVIAIAFVMAVCQPGLSEEAEWIWTPQQAKEAAPKGSCYFRKSFVVRTPERIQLTIAADDEYELYVNGRKVGVGQAYRELDEYDITPVIDRGRNTIAVKVTNRRGSTAALVARVLVKERNTGWVSHSTDGTWLVNTRPLPLWTTAIYNDRMWDKAQSFGTLGSTPPWDVPEDVASDETHRHERFRINKEFEVQRVIDAEETGSLIAMTFNEFGHVVASREGGPLLLIFDSNDDKIVDTVRVYCDKVKNVQGILPLNGDVYVTADGPDGAGLYRLSDSDRDGSLETTKLLFNFAGEVGEHSAHGLALGVDGWLYIVVGNHTQPTKDYDPKSPHRGYYEGDLCQPRYEDPGGHAANRKAPGGAILRTDLDGESVQLVAGGVRNAYDLAFSEDGDLFIHDSDMESDEGTTFYRPTRVCHVLPGSEFGWRSGWAKWPEYYVDSLPAIADTGRGSPTGAVFYHHHMFPRRFQNALFLADWSEGRILVTRFKPNGATYTTKTDVFLEGQPLNVTDLAVGPDGWLYFVTGGRGTGGGLYRVTWNGQVPDQARELGDGIAEAIRQPQLLSAWGRQRLAQIKKELGDDWGPLLLGVVRSTANPTRYRIRALNLMQLYGPHPAVPLLLELAEDKNEAIRAKAADMMGIHANDETHEKLLELLTDSDRMVRRRACEALVRAGQDASIEQLTPLLTSDDRFEAWSARRALEQSDLSNWRDEVLTTEDHRLFIQGALALLITEPTESNALDLLARISQLMTEFITDKDFIDMLRVTQVAIAQGQLEPKDLGPLRDQLAEEFPAGNDTMNRELIRLLAYLNASSIIDRYLTYLDSDAPKPERVHVAMHLRFLTEGWQSAQKLRLIEFLAGARKWQGGSSYPLYIRNVTRDFAKRLTDEEVVPVLKRGADWPDAALGCLYRLPAELTDELRSALIELDAEIDGRADAPSKQLLVGIVAVLARSGDETSASYLREIWDRNPERREPVAMGLAQMPDGENWDYLVRSLPIVEKGTLRIVLRQLQTVDKVPEDPESYRQTIIGGLKLKENGAADAIQLLQFWTDTMLAEDSDDWQEKLAAWQEWFVETFPDYPPATVPVDAEDSKWKYEELLDFLTGEESEKGDAERGALVFEKAECIKCHRYGDQGEAMGPDLTSIAKRFTRKEILRSMTNPSHVVPSEYAAKTLLLNDGRQIAGIVAPGPEGEKVVLKDDGEKVAIPEEEIDEILPSRISAMPDGLLNELTLEQIADLFEYMNQPPVQAVTRRIGD
jgi:putative heme-binding domain-containing protein